MFKNHAYLLSLYYRISDLLSLNIAFFLGIFIRFNWAHYFGFSEIDNFSLIDSNYASLLLFTNITWLFISSIRKVYLLQFFTSVLRYRFAIISAIFLQFLITIAFNGLIKTFYSRIFLFNTYLMFSVLLIVFRYIAHYLYKQIVVRKTKKNSVVLLGTKGQLSDLTDYISNNISIVRQKIVELEPDGIQLEQLTAINKEHPISEVFAPISKYSEEEIERLSDYCDNHFIRLRLVFDWKKVGTRNIEASKYNHTTVLKVTTTPLDDQYNALLKRGFDLIFSLLLCIFLFSWLFPILAIAVKMSSKGPVFFKQKRSGINNKGFNCYKFRSMRQNVEADSKQATQNDPRITKVGAFIRKTSLDELPQFINVIKGQMSIVGPRPHMLKHTEEYSNLVGNFMNRHTIKPGITGLAQIRGFRGEIDDFSLLQNRVRFDRFYVNNWTLFFDIKIVFLTVFTIFQDHR